jgi:hypothetical protein
MKTATKKHIRENTKRYQRFNYLYQHDNNTTFELRRVTLISIGIVIKHCDNDNSHIVIVRGVITSKKQFIDIIYDYLKFKNEGYETV